MIRNKWRKWSKILESYKSDRETSIWYLRVHSLENIANYLNINKIAIWQTTNTIDQNLNPRKRYMEAQQK